MRAIQLPPKRNDMKDAPAVRQHASSQLRTHLPSERDCTCTPPLDDLVKALAVNALLQVSVPEVKAASGNVNDGRAWKKNTREYTVYYEANTNTSRNFLGVR